MHMLMAIAAGLVLLAICYAAAPMLGVSRENGAKWFIWVWLVAALVNGVFGYARAGIPLLNEIGAFVPIFGIPAAAAWYLGFRR